MTRELFIQQVEACQEQLRRFLIALCKGDAFRADDIAQEALLRAYRSYSRFEGKSKFSTWLMKIGYNCFCDSVKADARSGGASLDEARLIVDKEHPPFTYQPLYMAIRDLSQTEQTVVLLFYMEDRSIKDIEDITGMPSGTIRSHLSRARVHLRKYLSEYDK